ncbi:fructosamine kinase family protein [Streptomyces sp. NPDC005134]
MRVSRRAARGPPVFVKAFREMPADGLFAAEAEGLRALRELGGAATPEVVCAGRDVPVLSVLEARPAREDFWERLAHTLARLHTTTVHDRFGWSRDNGLGHCRQDNTCDTDGHTFFARSRLLRWLPEPRVRAALDERDQRALERLCERLPELLPSRPACLTHGDLWAHNILATRDGQPALIDPAVSYMWPEVDLAHLWSSPHPPEAKRFFARYAELTGLRRRLARQDADHPVAAALGRHRPVRARLGCGGPGPCHAQAVPFVGHCHVVGRGGV